MKNKLQIGIIYIIPVCILLFYCSMFLSVNYMPKIFGDEYGYWAAGAFFSGLNWGDITALNEYYGWGYGLILSFILKMPIDAIFSYKLAILLNGGMLYITYLIVYKFTKEISVELDWNNVICSGVALMCTFLPSALYYTQYTSAEVMLCMVIWTVTYLEWRVIRKNLWYDKILLGFFCAILLSIHLRTIAIVLIALGLIIILDIVEKKNKKKTVALIVLILAFILCVSIVKEYYQQSFKIDFLEIKDGNTAVGQVGKIKQFFTIDGFISFFHNFIGRLYTVGVDSYLLGIFSCVVGIGKIVKTLRKKGELQKREIIFLVSFFNMLSVVAISALYMLGDEFTRFDIMTYSRYHEFTVGPMILFGVIYLYDSIKNEECWKWIIVTICSISLCTLTITSIQNYQASISNMFINFPLGFFWYTKSESPYMYYNELFAFSVVVFLFIYVLLNYNKNKALIIFSVIAILFNVYESQFILKNGCLNWSVSESETTKKTVEYIVQNNYENDLFFPADDNVLKVEGLQFLLKNNKIHVNTLENLVDMQGGTIITTNNYENAVKLEQKNFKEIYDGTYIKIWRKDH